MDGREGVSCYRYNFLLLRLMIKKQMTWSTHGSGCRGQIWSPCSKHTGKGSRSRAGTPTTSDFYVWFLQVTISNAKDEKKIMLSNANDSKVFFKGIGHSGYQHYKMDMT